MESLSDQQQHYVPQGYLKGFTEASNGFFHQLRKNDLRLRKQHTSTVCFATNFYDITDESILKRFSVKPRHLEYSFKYENELPSLLKQIQNHDSYLSRKEFELIVEAYISIKHRTPYYRKTIDQLHRQGNGKLFDNTAIRLKDEMKWLLDPLPDFSFDRLAAKFKQQMLQDDELGKKSQHRSLIETERHTNEPVRDAITKILMMNISIMEITSKESYFFVSDNPGFSIQRYSNKVFNTNYGEFDMIFFPINSTQAILLHGFDPLNYIRPLIRLRYVPIKRDILKAFNRQTYELADEFVFCENRPHLERFKDSLK